MKKNLNNLILIFLLLLFAIVFKFNSVIRDSILDSCTLWFKTLLPSMFIMYTITDLLFNYGLSNCVFKVFKNNRAILIIISMLLGCPANAKYIRDFYKDGYISIGEAEWLLTFSYSPNPLFILSIAPNLNLAITTLGVIYATNILISFLTKKMIYGEKVPSRSFKSVSFSKCLESSIYKTFKILILILGIVIVYGSINTILDIFMPGDNIFIKSVLEMTNALKIITTKPEIYRWMLFATSFGGLSIHTQIKSILSDTPINYKYFLYGRIFASIVALILAIFF